MAGDNQEFNQLNGSQEVSSTNEPEFRHNRAQYESVIQRGSITPLQTGTDESHLPYYHQARSPENAPVAETGYFRQRYPSLVAASAESARILATFDENYKGVQPCEFYVIKNRAYERRGHF